MNLPSYKISTAGLNEINLRSGRVVNSPTSPIITEKFDGGNTEPEQGTFRENLDQNIINQTPPQDFPNQGHLTSPPYPGRFTFSKPNPQAEFDFLGELQNLFIKIPLLQAMRDVPIYKKILKEYC